MRPLNHTLFDFETTVGQLHRGELHEHPGNYTPNVVPDFLAVCEWRSGITCIGRGFKNRNRKKK